MARVHRCRREKLPFLNLQPVQKLQQVQRLFPVLAFKWAMDGEDDDDSPEAAILFYEKGMKLTGKKLETSFEDDLQAVVKVRGGPCN